MSDEKLSEEWWVMKPKTWRHETPTIYGFDYYFRITFNYHLLEI